MANIPDRRGRGGEVRRSSRQVLVVEPGEGARGGRGGRIDRLRGLAPRRDLADEGDALVELAQPVDQLLADGAFAGIRN
jgi:hypothetical protein